MLRALLQFRRVLSVLGILALMGAGLVSAAAPVHAAGTQTAATKTALPCHHAKAVGATPFDFCKARCLAAAPERFVGFAISGHVFPDKVIAVFAAACGVEVASQPLRLPPAHYYLHRHYSAVPTYLRNQRLLI